MIDSAPSVLRRWDGKTKTATVWLEGTDELRCCPENGNCYVYISEEQSQQPKPSFKIPFDILIIQKCQPLISKVLITTPFVPQDLHSASSPTKEKNPKVSGRRKSTCLLHLTPPDTSNENEKRQYNVTTRNFFAWLLGLPIVGLDPASALLALKIRMDVWRAAACDNTTAVYEYAQAQSYGELGDVQLFMTNHLRGRPNVPIGYTLSTAMSHEHVDKPHVGRSEKLRRTLTRGVTGFGARGRRWSWSQDHSPPPNEHLHFTGIDHRTLPAIDTSNLDLSYDVSLQNKRPDAWWTTAESLNEKEDASTPVNLHEIPDLPELDGNNAITADNLEKQTSWISNISKEASPTTQTPAPHMNAARRQEMMGSQLHSSPNNRRNKSRSRPPSPILEEVVLPIKGCRKDEVAGITVSQRRYSHPDPSSVSSVAAQSARKFQPSQGNNSRSHHSSVSLPGTMYPSLQTCSSCHRFKASPSRPLQGDRASLRNLTTASNEMTNITDLTLQPSHDDANLQRYPSRKGKGKAKQMQALELVRFPSLHSLRAKPEQTVRPAIPFRTKASVPDTNEGNSERRRTLTIASSGSTSASFVSPSPSRKMKSTSLHEQRYTISADPGSSLRHSTTVKQLSSQLNTSETNGIQSDPSKNNDRFSSDPSGGRSAFTSVPTDQSEQPLEHVESPQPRQPVMLRSDGSKVSLALLFDGDEEVPARGSLVSASTTSSKMENTSWLIKDEAHELLLDQLLDSLQTIEKSLPVRTSAAKKRTNKSAFGTSDSPTSLEGHPKKLKESQSDMLAERTPMVTNIEVQRTTTTGSKIGMVLSPLKRRATINMNPMNWANGIKTRSAMETKMDNDRPDRLANGVLGCDVGNVKAHGNVQVRVLTLDQRGKFSTVVIESRAVDGLSESW